MSSYFLSIDLVIPILAILVLTILVMCDLLAVILAIPVLNIPILAILVLTILVMCDLLEVVLFILVPTIPVLVILVVIDLVLAILVLVVCNLLAMKLIILAILTVLVLVVLDTLTSGTDLPGGTYMSADTTVPGILRDVRTTAGTLSRPSGAGLPGRVLVA